jgi:hypothetical protein
MTPLRLLALFSLFLPIPAQAAVVTRITEFEPHIKVTADELNNEFDNIISAINGNLDSSNISGGGIATGNIATGAITQVKMAPSNWATSNGVTASTANGTIGGPGSTSPTLTTVLTLTGTRAVRIGLQSHDNLSSCVPGTNPLGMISIDSIAGGTGDVIAAVLYRNGIRVSEVKSGGMTIANSGADAKVFYAPVGGINFFDIPSAGGSTSYEVKFYGTDSAATINVTCVKAFAVEL